jgi:hypothetical protein
VGNRKANEGDIDYARVIGDDTLAFRSNLTFKWKETNMQAGLRIPLILTRSRYNTNISLLNYIGYTSVENFENSIDGGGRILPSNLPQYIFRDYIDQGNLLYNHFGLTAYHLLKQSRRDINSRWGQQAFINAYATPYGGDYSGSQLSAYGILYFPGAVKHHSLWGYGAYQFTEIQEARGEGLNNYFFRNRIPLPRGLSVSRFEHFYTLSANYAMPLWYPDIAIGPLLNIQRFRTNLFYDYGYGQSPQFDFAQRYSSAGVELKADLNIMRFFPQFDIGIRFTQGLEPATTKFEVLIGTFNF